MAYTGSSTAPPQRPDRHDGWLFGWLVERSRRMADRPQHSAAPIAPTQRSSWLRQHRCTHVLALDYHPTPSLLPGLLGHQPPATTSMRGCPDRHHRPSDHRRHRALSTSAAQPPLRHLAITFISCIHQPSIGVNSRHGCSLILARNDTKTTCTKDGGQKISALQLITSF